MSWQVPGLLWLDLGAAGGMVTGPERKGQCSLWGSSQQIVLMPSGKHLPGLLGGFFPASYIAMRGKKNKKAEFY